MMAKDEKTEEELKAEAAKAEEAKAEEEKKEDSPEISEEALKRQTDFDEQLDSDDDNPAVEDGGDDDAKGDEKAAKGDEKKDADDDPAKEKPGEEDAGEETAEEKELREAADAIEKEAAAEAGKTDADRQAEADAKVAAEAKVAEAKKDADKPYNCGLDPEDYDEEWIRIMNEQGQRLQDDAKAVKTENAELRAMVSGQANQRYADWLDRKIGGLGDDFVEVLGEGEFDDLTPGSEQSENRMKLGRRMGLIQAAYQRLNKTLPSRNKLFDQAVSFEFKKQKNKSKTEAKTAKELKARSGQTLGGGGSKASASAAAQKSLEISKKFDAKLDEED